jgi:hypothetical protein
MIGSIRSALVIGSLICLAVLTAGGLARAATPVERRPDPRGRAPEVRPSEIRGTVHINGWAGDPSEIKVYAIPGGAESPEGTRSTPEPRAAERAAALMKTGEPNEFTFSIMGLHPHTPYRLGIELPPNPIRPPVFWRGLMGGIAMSGAPPVAIEGFVARTEIEIRDSQGNWVGADDLQFSNSETALRTLRWKSSIRGTVAGELQISTRAFPIKGNFGSCDEPAEGLIYRKEFPAARSGEWQEIGSLDFSQILRQGRTLPPTDDRPPTDEVPAGLSADDMINASSEVSTISDRDLRMLTIGAPLYLRVVPVTERGRACDVKEDGVHGWVILAKLPRAVSEEPEPPAPIPANIEPLFQVYTPPVLRKFADGQIHPTMKGDSTYYVIKDHKLPPCKSWEYGNSGKGPCAFLSWPGATWKYSDLTHQWYLVNQYDPLGQIMVDSLTWVEPNKLFHTGDVFTFKWVYYSSGSCSGFCLVGEVFKGLVTAAVTGFGDFATYLAESFESIKDGVATVVADVVTFLPVIGDACNLVTSCKNVIKFGMETGLASMGLPPSLPNWNELKDQGMDYLASEIATEMASATGLPEEVTKLVADQTMKLAKDMAQKTMNAMTKNQGSENGVGYDWVLPYSGIDPAVWKIWVEKKEGVNLMSNLYLRTRGFASFFDLYINSGNPFIDNLYVPGEIHVPTEFPSSNVIMVPILLRPDFSTIPPPKCLQSPGYPVTCIPSPNVFNIPQCLTGDGYNPFKPYDCKLLGWTNYLGVYYRDYWIDKRLDTFNDCFYLKARADTQKSSIEDIIKQLTDPLFDPWLPYYPPFHDFAVIGADQPAFWTEPFYVGPGCK